MSKTNPDSLPSLFSDAENDEPIGAARRCSDCGATAPGTRTAYTLISAKHGWRLLREPDGQMMWLCPGCANARRGRVPESAVHRKASDRAPDPAPKTPPTARADLPSEREAPEEGRGTGAVDMLSNLTRSMLDTLRPRAGTNPAVDRLLGEVSRIRAELDGWVADPPTAKRRSEMLSAILSLNREVNELRG